MEELNQQTQVCVCVRAPVFLNVRGEVSVSLCIDRCYCKHPKICSRFCGTTKMEISDMFLQS